MTLALLPHASLLVFGLAMLVILPFTHTLKQKSGRISLILLTLSTLPLAITYQSTGQYFNGAIQIDPFATFFVLVFHSVAFLVILASLDYIKTNQKNQLEYYSLILLGTAGMDIIATGTELITIFIALEIISLSTYALIAFNKNNVRSTEAAIKYFLLGAFSSGILLFGISLIYGSTSTTYLAKLATTTPTILPLFALGTLMFIAGFAFKVAAVPFHTWAPDTYEGAPTPISAYLASGSKAAGFVVLLRIFYSYLSPTSDLWITFFAAIAILTMVIGNVAALPQRNMKRLLAYSGVAHTGYLLIVLVTLNDLGKTAAMLHLLVYAFMNTGPFLFIAFTKRAGIGENIDDLKGLYRRAPYMAVSLAVFMFALTGLPPTGGFFTKLFIFLSAIQAGYWWLAAIGVVMSGLSLYYYVRILKYAFIDEPRYATQIRKQDLLELSVFICAIVTVLTFVAFSPLWDYALHAAASL